MPVKRLAQLLPRSYVYPSLDLSYLHLLLEMYEVEKTCLCPLSHLSSLSKFTEFIKESTFLASDMFSPFPSHSPGFQSLPG